MAVVSFFSPCEHGFEPMICAAVVGFSTASGLIESAYWTDVLVLEVDSSCVQRVSSKDKVVEYAVSIFRKAAFGYGEGMK